MEETLTEANRRNTVDLVRRPRLVAGSPPNRAAPLLGRLRKWVALLVAAEPPFPLLSSPGDHPPPALLQ